METRQVKSAYLNRTRMYRKMKGAIHGFLIIILLSLYGVPQTLGKSDKPVSSHHNPPASLSKAKSLTSDCFSGYSTFASDETILGLDRLSATAYSLDRKYAVTAGSMGAFLWNVETGNLIHIFTTQACDAGSVAFSPDGSKVLVSNEKGIVRIWNLNSFPEKRALQNFSIKPNAVIPLITTQYTINGGAEAVLADGQPIGPASPGSTITIKIAASDPSGLGVYFPSGTQGISISPADYKMTESPRQVVPPKASVTLTVTVPNILTVDNQTATVTLTIKTLGEIPRSGK